MRILGIGSISQGKVNRGERQPMVVDTTKFIEVNYGTQPGGYVEHSPNMEMDDDQNTLLEANFTHRQIGESVVMVRETQKINPPNMSTKSKHQTILANIGLDSTTTSQKTWNKDG